MLYRAAEKPEEDVYTEDDDGNLYKNGELYRAAEKPEDFGEPPYVPEKPIEPSPIEQPEEPQPEEPQAAGSGSAVVTPQVPIVGSEMNAVEPTPSPLAQVSQPEPAPSVATPTPVAPINQAPIIESPLAQVGSTIKNQAPASPTPIIPISIPAPSPVAPVSQEPVKESPLAEASKNAPPEILQDEAGNYWSQGADGSYTLVDAFGNPIPDAVDTTENPVYDYAEPTPEPTPEKTVSSYEATDDAGNVWQVNPDGSFNLIKAAENPSNPVYDYVEPPEPEETIQPYQTTDQAGNVWLVNPNGTFELVSAAEQSNPIYDYGPDPVNDYLTYDFDSRDSYVDPRYNTNPNEEMDYKHGGLTTMKKGGLPRFEEGGDVFANPDYTKYTSPQMDVSDPSFAEDPSVDDVAVDESQDEYTEDAEGNVYKNGQLYRAVEYTEDESGNVYKDGQLYRAAETPEATGDYLEGETPMQDEAGNEWAVDADGNYRLVRAFGSEDPITVQQPPEETSPPVSSGNTGGTSNQTGTPAYANTTPKATTPAPTAPKQSPLKNAGDKILEYLKDPKVQSAGLTAGMIASLMALMKDGSSSYKAPSVTMPTIAPRTTDFGMGPARVVTPSQPNLQQFTPQEETDLYTNLGVPGYEMEYEDPEQEIAQPPTGGLGATSPAAGMRAPSPPVNQYGVPDDSAFDPNMFTTDAQYRGSPTVDENASAPEGAVFAQGGLSQQAPASPKPNSPYYTYGKPQDPLEILGVRGENMMDEGGQAMNMGGMPHPVSGVPLVQGRHDYRQGSAVRGAGDGQSDDIPAMLADGEYVFDSDVVAALGNGSNKAGAEVLDRFREQIRAHKRSAHVGKIPPKAKSPLAYLKEAQK